MIHSSQSKSAPKTQLQNDNNNHNTETQPQSHSNGINDSNDTNNIEQTNGSSDELFGDYPTATPEEIVKLIYSHIAIDI